MLFNSIDFLLFFPVVLIIYLIINNLIYDGKYLQLRNLFLLGASYYFYMNWEPVYALLLLYSTTITWLAGLAISKTTEVRRKKVWLTIIIIMNLAVLFLFKYFNFAAENIMSMMRIYGLSIEIPKFTLLLPVGISFYIFQALGYSIDVYRGTTKVEKNFFTYALFVSFFPQLVAGPIERSNNLLQQFKSRRLFTYEHFWHGLKLMLWGYFLKLFMADRCGLYVDAIFNNIDMHNGGSYLLAALIFPFQIYGDFAGYSLIAIGVAEIMGFHLMDNFRRPYFATTVTEFWHRWHISLSTWFKDYVYIPLGGNRCSKLHNYFNIFITFLVSGVWHGANWTFILWGGLHGAIQCVEKVLGWNKKKYTDITKVFHMIFTFCIVAFAWVLFRASSLGQAGRLIQGILTDFTKPSLLSLDLIPIAIAILLVILKDAKDEYQWPIQLADSKYWIVRHAYAVILIVTIILLGRLDSSQFIYFQF